jgi:hypothetical protein
MHFMSMIGISSFLIADRQGVNQKRFATGKMVKGLLKQPGESAVTQGHWTTHFQSTPMILS